MGGQERVNNHSLFLFGLFLTMTSLKSETHEKVISFLFHLRPWMAYRFLLRLLFSSAPNLSGTPHRGRFMALPKTQDHSEQEVGGGAGAAASELHSLDGVVVDDAGDGEAVEPLHGADGRGDGVGRAEGVSPHVAGGQVTVLLQPRLWDRNNGVSHGNAELSAGRERVTGGPTVVCQSHGVAVGFWLTGQGCFHAAATKTHSWPMVLFSHLDVWEQHQWEQLACLHPTTQLYSY